MILSFKHKGLQRFFKQSDYRGIPAQYATRIERMLDRLDAAVVPEDMNLPGYRFHPLKGNRLGTFSVMVTGNWRITFTVNGRGMTDINLEDHH